ncbi:cytochrome c4 [bacterium]|nr:cytochrome c4 [bacterium]
MSSLPRFARATLVLAGALVFCGPALAAGAAVAPGEVPKAVFEGDAEAGAKKANACVACHGPGGNSTNPVWPKIAGQGGKYLYQSMKAYKNGERKNALMAGQMAALSAKDIRNLAAHYAAGSQTPGVGAEDAVEVAQPLYRAGDAERGIPACLACHGPAGTGNPAAAYPRIGGQHAEYTAIALKAYRNGERSAGNAGQMMTAVAQELTDDEISALASYIAGLQP